MSRPRLLVVDDHEMLRAALVDLLVQAGFEVAGEAADGESSVELARSLAPDLVLMDVHLPGIDGFEASRRILAASGTRPPVIFLISTYEAAEYLDQPTDCGAAAYLAKAHFGSAALSAAWAAVVAST
jgi:two-component system, response regulator PdtaR